MGKIWKNDGRTSECNRENFKGSGQKYVRERLVKGIGYFNILIGRFI